MPAPKGTRPPAAGKGRPKGARNKLTRDIREMIRAALDKAGGIAYLVKQAELNPTAFVRQNEWRAAESYGRSAWSISGCVIR